VKAVDGSDTGPSNGTQKLTLIVTAPPSYTLSATTLSPGSVTPGSSASSTITITPANGYTGSVTVSCSSITGGGSPAPTCAFSKNPITISGTGAGTATLTVSTSSSTATGTYTITVKAIDGNNEGSSNGTQNLTLTVTSAPSYTLSATALSPGSVTPGSSATSTITITPANGYTGSVTVSCSSITGGGSPAPTCAFSKNPITISGTGAGTATLTVSTSSSTPAATYTITVKAVDGNNLGSSNGTQALTLKVTSPPSYSLTASALNPATVTAGNTATSTITFTPANGYTGSITPSCSSITGGTPAPTCSFSPGTVSISGTTAVTSTLTVTTATGTPGGTYTITVTASDANQSGPSNGSQNLSLITSAVVTNVVLIIQENRTPDNLFYGLCISPYGSTSACSTTPSATQYDIQTSNWLNNQVPGGVTQPGALDLGTTGLLNNPDNYDLGHTHTAFEDLCDLNKTTNICAMDGADLISTSCNTGTVNCPPPSNPEFYYVYPEDVLPYLQMAQTYAFGDHMFQTNEGPSYPAHQFLLGGTSEPTTDSVDFVSENVLPITALAGCLADPTVTSKVIDPFGNETVVYNTDGAVCNEHATLTDSLDNANISWRYYAPSAGSIWTAPTAINHMCVPNPPAPNATECSGTDYTNANPKVVLNQTQTNAQILSDISGGTLQQVSWIIPSGNDSDHPKGNSGCGPSWVTEIVNAIGTSPYWQNTVIILTWDDWGGWYDHVPPPLVIDDGVSWGSGYVYGMRVPLLVISPYAKPAYISHVNHDVGSILKYIENTYNLPALGTADTYALDDLSDMFQFTSSPTTFTPFAGPWNDATCKGDTSPPSDPDDY
jgi:phospholipase C